MVLNINANYLEMLDNLFRNSYSIPIKECYVVKNSLIIFNSKFIINQICSYIIPMFQLSFQYIFVNRINVTEL